jgi:nucleotide-binding universal stress UspA family protein
MGAPAHLSDKRCRRLQRTRGGHPRPASQARRHEPAIVCGVDGSPHARVAACLAADLAERLARRLVLVHALPWGVPPVAASVPEAAGREVDAARRLREELRAQLIASQVEIEFRNGPPSRCILAIAAERKAALIVLGCRGVGTLRAAVFGSVTDEIVRKAPCPMVIVPPATAGTGTIRLTGSSVLCGVQRFEDLACARVAQELARDLGVRLVLAHVLPRSADVAALTPAGVIRAQLQARGITREQAALVALGRVHEELTRDDVAHLRVRRGNAARQLDELAVTDDAMLVVTGTRRWRGPVRAAVFGSVSRWLSRAGQRPTVICPQGLS